MVRRWSRAFLMIESIVLAFYYPPSELSRYTTMTSRAVVRVLLLTLMLLVAFGIGERYSASSLAQSRQKWEYQVVKADRIDRDGGNTSQIRGLKELGEEGWEAAGMNDSWVLL